MLGESEIDLQASDIARFYDHQKTRKHIKDRTAEGFNKTYGIVHPNEQWASNRNVRLSPYYERQKALGAEFYETVGWERPFWYESNAGLVEKFGDAVMPRTAEWESRWWSPIINAEHLQMRETAGLVDLTAFVEFDVQGPGRARHGLQRVCMRQMDVPIGRVVYTPVLSSNGGFKSDLTVMRLAHDHFRVVTGGAHGMADLKWFSDHLPDGRHGADHRPDVRAHHARHLGPEGSRDPPVGHAGRRLARGLQVRHLQDDRDRAAARSWRRASRTSVTSAGSSTCRWSRALSCGTRSGRPVSRTG